jgi:hypothetical protein
MAVRWRRLTWNTHVAKMACSRQAYQMTESTTNCGLRQAGRQRALRGGWSVWFRETRQELAARWRSAIEWWRSGSKC